MLFIGGNYQFINLLESPNEREKNKIVEIEIQRSIEEIGEELNLCGERVISKRKIYS